MQTQQPKIQEEWINILTKGIITIPKKMRERIGIREGDIAKIKTVGNTIVIEPRNKLSFNEIRTFSNKELERWIREDKLPTNMAKRTSDYWKDLP